MNEELEKEKDLQEHEVADILFDDFTYTEAKGEDGVKRMRVVACVQEADKINKNNRIYPRDVLEDAVADLKARIAKKRVFGQTDHPMLSSGRLSESSHITTDVYWEDGTNRLIAEHLILNTPSGEILKEIVRAGGRPGMSSRGRGTSVTKKIGGREVEEIQKGFRFDGFDFVINPSVTTARIRKIIESAVEAEEEKTRQEETMNEKELTKEILKEEHSELYEEIVKEAKEESKEIEKKVEDLNKKLEDAEKSASELEAQLSELKDEVERHITTIEGVIELLKAGGYLNAKESGSPSSGEDDDKRAAEAEEELEKLKIQLEAKEVKVKELSDELEKIKAEAQKQEIEAYIAEKTASHKFSVILKEKLKAQEFKSKEEVDQAIKDYDEFIEGILGSKELLRGKGKMEDQDGKTGNADDEIIRKKAKKLAEIE